MGEIVVPGGSRARLWFAKRKPQDGFLSLGSYRPADRMNIMLMGDLHDRRATHAVICFPKEGYAFRMDAPQIKAAIEKLQSAYAQVVGKGQAKVISFENRKDWTDGVTG